MEVAWQGLGWRCRAPGGSCRGAEAAEQAWPKSGMWTVGGREEEERLP